MDLGLRVERQHERGHIRDSCASILPDQGMRAKVKHLLTRVGVPPQALSPNVVTIVATEHVKFCRSARVETQ